MNANWYIWFGLCCLVELGMLFLAWCLLRISALANHIDDPLWRDDE